MTKTGARTVRRAARDVRLRIGERRLANGLTLLAVRNPHVATFAAGLFLDVDRRDEGPGQHGLANLVGDCLDEGTVKRDDLQLAAQLDKIGATLDGHSSGGTVQCPAESARRGLGLLVEVVNQPAFPAAKVRRVKDEIVQELLTDADDPRTVAADRFRQRVYGRHPYGRSVRGTARAVRGFSPADLRRFHAAQFRPTRGYFAAAGPAAVDAMLDELERASRGMRGSKPERAPLRAPGLPDGVREEHIAMPREQVHVYLGHVGVARTHPDFYALSVMDHILGTGPGFTSRIARSLRDEQGLCYSVDASITRDARDEPGVFAAYIGTSPQHRGRAIAGFRDEMRRMRETLPSEDELRDVQAYLTGSFVWQLERNASLVRYAVRAAHFQLGMDYVRRYPDLIGAVTREEVQRVAAAHLHPEQVAIVSCGG